MELECLTFLSVIDTIKKGKNVSENCYSVTDRFFILHVNPFWLKRIIPQKIVCLLATIFLNRETLVIKHVSIPVLVVCCWAEERTAAKCCKLPIFNRSSSKQFNQKGRPDVL
jgi:hypothetical protein